MLNDEICKLRDKLNNSIETGQDYNLTYQLSVELDGLISKYYKDLEDNKENEELDNNDKEEELKNEYKESGNIKKRK